MQSRDDQILGLQRVVETQGHLVHSRYGGDLEELLSDGWVGAIEAVDRFRPDNEAGATLSTFARHRIRGAMLDGLRARDHLTAHQKLTLRAEDRPPAPLSLDAVGPTAWGHLEDRAAGEAITSFPDRHTIFAALLDLAPRQRYVIVQRYFAGRNLRAIGHDLGVTEARACQVSAQAHRRLRAGLAPAFSRG